MKEAEVYLVSWTNKPIETMFWAFLNMHNEVPVSLDKIKLSEEHTEKFIDLLIKIPHQTVMEFVNTNWLIKNASRAFQQQLTRTRVAAYSIQSLRIVNPGDFAEQENYHTPYKVSKNYIQKHLYEEAMYNAQESYEALIKEGASTEDARGVLPLNINSPITMSIQLRSLAHMLELRFCQNTQDEFRSIAQQMKQEIMDKIDPRLGELFKPMCEHNGICNSAVPCPKAKNYKTICDSSALDLGWLKG